MIEPYMTVSHLDGSRRDISIAVIDDDEHVRAIIKDVLEDEGYVVELYHTTQDALEWLLKIAPSLLILDIRIGHSESGWQLLKTLRLDPRLKDTPVIICTAAAKFVASHREQLAQLNCYVITKPFDLDPLINMVATALFPAQL